MLSPTKSLQVVAFLDMLAVGLIIPQLQMHAQKLGCSHLLIGIMGAVYSVAQLISGPLIGNLSDTKGRKSTLLLSTLAICGGAYFVLEIATSIILFLSTRALLGVFKQTQLLTKSIAPDLVTEPGQHSAIFGKLATLSGMGMALGPVTSGHIVELCPESGFNIIANIVAAIYAVNFILVYLLPDTDKLKPKNENDQKTERTNTTVSSSITHSIRNSITESLDELKKVNWAVYWDVFLYKLIITLCVGMYFNTYSIFLRTKHKVSPKYLGYIIAFQGSIGTLCTYFIEHINNLYKDDLDATKRTLHVFIVITLSLVSMGLASHIYLYVLFVVPLAVSGAVYRVTSLEMILNKGQNEHRGSVMGATGSVRSVSGVVTPLLSGIVSEYVGVNYVIFFAAMFSAIGILVSYTIRSQKLTLEKSKTV